MKNDGARHVIDGARADELLAPADRRKQGQRKERIA
jgi:hypothetical protein